MNSVNSKIEEQSKAIAKNIAVLEYRDKFSNEVDMRVAEYCIYKAIKNEKMASRWRKVSEELPPVNELVIVSVRNKNKPDGVYLYDVCYIDEGTNSWGDRLHTWEDITEWKYIN